VTIARTSRRHQRFSGAAWLPGRRQDIGAPLILMGDGHDSVVASIEKTGSTGTTVRHQWKLCCQKNQRDWIGFAL